MADVTISGLSLGSPNKDTAVIPYSDGSTTYKTNPSGIVAASPGSVLQTVSFSNLPSLDIGDVGNYFISVSITPRFASSKILVTMGTIAHRSVGNTGDFYQVGLVRNNDYNNPLTLMHDAALYQSFGNGARDFCCTTYLDSPNTTNTITYRGYAKRIVGTNGVSYATFNVSNTGYATLQEIAG
jgi:hypothetical protein